MPWTKIDDGFFGNAKIVAAGNAAAGVYVRALSWSNANLTDGFVPEGVAAMLAGADGPALLECLVTSKLWAKVKGGYQAPDFLEFNPSAEQVRSERAAAKERMANARKRSRDVRANINRSIDEPKSATETVIYKTESRVIDNVSSVRPNTSGTSPEVRPTPLPEEEKKNSPLTPLPAEPTVVGGPPAVGRGTLGEQDGLQLADRVKIAAGSLPCGITPTQADQLEVLTRSLLAQHYREDFLELFGAYAAAGCFRWMTTKRPSLGRLLTNDGAEFVEYVDRALAWDSDGRPGLDHQGRYEPRPAAVVLPLRTPSKPAAPMTPEQRQAAANELRSGLLNARRGRRDNA